jgi:hypothetical protein
MWGDLVARAKDNSSVTGVAPGLHIRVHRGPRWTFTVHGLDSGYTTLSKHNPWIAQVVFSHLNIEPW